MLYTKWGEDLNKDCPLGEYPRPQFVRDSYMSLNGKWKISFCENESLDAPFDTDIIVPFSPETPLSGVGKVLSHNEYLMYRRTFVLTDDFNRGRVILHFGAVDQIAKVYINGEFVGAHHGGYTPFEFEITDYVVSGENSVIVSVQIGRASCRERV